jgi:CDP-diacylglycerol--serine O-phosphatidyltransferase
LRLARFNVSVGRTDPKYFVGMPITAGAACVASVVVAWPFPPETSLHGWLVVGLLFAVGSLMVSTIRFPSSKQKKSVAALVLLLVNVGLLVWLRFYYFVLFFVIYIVGTLALNLAWKRGWKGVPPPLVYDEE